MGITYKNDGFFGFSNIKSFQTFHIAQRIAQTPTRTCINSFLGISANQFPNRLLTLVGGEMPNVI
jgi:hypothetical protein